MSDHWVDVRNVTEAVPGLLRLLVGRGRRGADGELAVEGRVTVVLSEPWERVIAWPCWPRSPFSVFEGVVEGVEAVEFDEGTLGADAGLGRGTTFYAGFDRSVPLRDLVELLVPAVSVALEMQWVWRGGAPGPVLSVTTEGLTCPGELVDSVGELLLEVEPYPVLPVPDRVDLQAVREFRRLKQVGMSAIGYRSRWIRRVAVPLLRAARAEKPAEVLEAADETDWVVASRRWLEGRR